MQKKFGLDFHLGQVEMDTDFMLGVTFKLITLFWMAAAGYNNHFSRQ